LISEAMISSDSIQIDRMVAFFSRK